MESAASAHVGAGPQILRCSVIVHQLEQGILSPDPSKCIKEQPAALLPATTPVPQFPTPVSRTDTPAALPF